MRFRIVIVAAVAMVLSGCGWVGPPLYKGDPTDAGPIKPGLYKIDVLGDGKPAHLYRIAWLPDGSTSWTPLRSKKKEEPWRQIAVRFAVPGRQVWILQDAPDEGQTQVDYGLAELHADILWVMPFIDCDSTAEIVRAAGGEVEDNEASNVVEANDMSPSIDPPTPKISEKPTGQRCRFKDRDSLERALRAYIASNPTKWVRVRFKRISD
ncbi:MAG: hypothetical protein JWM94_1777 [Sphingomonas bacterium]|nr:hypothetical protein [Sphingomonas bacterium]